jgi:digeranylgeranylglycerophospholipid reductase
VVIGGGPIGSRVAGRLSCLGHQVGVLEKELQIGAKPCCTGIISQECVTSFQIPSTVIYQSFNSASIFSSSATVLHIHRPEVQACVLDRQAFDGYLAERAKERGAEYYLGSKAESLSIKADRVVVDVEEKGRKSGLEARSVVLATGFNAPLVKKLGLGQVGYCVAGAQIEAPIKDLREVEVYFDQTLAPGFFAWLVPTSSGKARVGLITRHSPGAHLRAWMKTLEARRKIDPGEYEIRYGGIPLRPLNRTYGERLLVVGDAAGQVKPTTGGGLYFGLISADMAAETLHQALETGDLSAKNLSQYDKEWRKKLSHELRIEYLARRMYERLSDRQIDRLLSVLQSSGVADSLIREESLSFDWHGGLMMKLLKYGISSQTSRLLRLHPK